HAHFRAVLIDSSVPGEALAVVQIITDASEISIHFDTVDLFKEICEQFNVSYSDMRRRKEEEPAHIQCGTGSNVPAGLEARQMQPVSTSAQYFNSGKNLQSLRRYRT